METYGALATIDYVILVVYFLAIVAAGVYFSKKAAQGIDAYFLGKRSIPWWALGMSGTASNFDMTGTMVITSFFFAIGLQGFWVAMRGGMVLPLGILMIYMGKWMRRSRVMTNAEWMELRFGSGRQGQLARLLSAVSTIVVTLAFLVYFVKGTGLFLSIYLPLSPTACALLMMAVALTYTAISGFYGVIYTDVIQEVLILGVSLYVGYLAFTLPDHAQVLEQAGPGWSDFAPRWTAEPMTWLANPDVYRFFGLCIVFWIARGIFEGVGGFTGNYMNQRYFAARNDRETGLMSAEWVVLLFFRWSLVIGTVLLGLSLARRSPEIGELLARDPEKTLPVVLGQAIPAGVRGLLVAGLVAAAMSTFDSTINSGVSYWVKDIYQRHLRPRAERRELMLQSYLGTLVFAAVAVILALGVKNIDDIWAWITGPLSAGLFVPIILRWYWWRFNGYGFALATAAGLAVSVWTQTRPEMPFYEAFLAAAAASLLAGVAGSLATPATDPETLERFWRRIRPFGFWGRVRARLEPELTERVGLRNTIDVLAVPFAVAWQLSGVVAVISLLLRKWTTFAAAAAVFALLSYVLYFTWYRNLQTREEGEAQALEGD